MESPIISGNLQILTKGNPISSVFARLLAFRIEMWTDEQMCNNEVAYKTIEITRETKMKLKNDLEIMLIVMEEGTVHEYVLRTENGTDTTKWMSKLKICIKEHLQWGHVALTNAMKLAMPGNCKQYFLRSPRQGSLYDQVPILGNMSVE